MATTATDAFRNGVLLRREAIEMGIDDDTLTKSVRQGQLVRIRQGAYAQRSVWAASDATVRHTLLTEAVSRLYDRAVLISRTSAAVSHGAPTFGLDLSVVDISHRGGSGRTQGSVRHHAGVARSDDIRRADGSMVTSIPRTVIETTMQSRRLDVGVVLASHYLHHGHVTAESLEAARQIAGECPGSLVLRTALALADSRLESVAEARCWLILRRSGLPDVVPQYPLSVDGRRPLRLDFAIPDLGLWVEVDGRQKYERYRRAGESLTDYLIRERRRENLIREITGWDVLRITWADLADPARLVERILALAARRGARS